LSIVTRLALVLLGTALLAALWIGGRTIGDQSFVARRGDRRTAVSVPATGKPTETVPARKDATAAPTGYPVRRIAPGDIASPQFDGPLERVPPREPLAAATRPLKREPFGPGLPQGTLLYQPIAEAAGALDANGFAIRLAGIEVTPADATCADRGGGRWPCGAVARTQFRSWMRGRAVACDVPPAPKEIVTRCTLDGEDMARWLVEHGWARSAGGQYDDAEAKARKKKQGMFGPSPLEAAE
jgi:endonuclease YncB( thermonuclease family)